MFKFNKEYEEKKKREHELKFVVLDDGTQKHISEFSDRSITPEMVDTFRMNSYTRNSIYPKLTDDAVLQTAEYYISQCSKPHIISTYNDAVIHLILPELIKRYKELIEFDKSKEESSIYYYSRTKELEDELKKLTK